MVCVTVSCHTSGYQHSPAGVTEPYRSWPKEIVARTSIRGTQVSVEHRFSNIQNLTSKSHVQIASRPVRFPLTPAINVTHPRNSTVLQPLIFLSSTPKVLLSALTWPAHHVTAYVESHPERRWLTQSVADDMMLKSYKGRRIPQPEFECAENHGK